MKKNTAKAPKPRIGKMRRKTKETDITVIFNLDGHGKSKIKTGIGFLDHMLDLFTRHGIFDATVKAKGDLQIDIHHTNEDIGITMGLALKQALGDKKGIRRFGSAFVPMDETLSRVRCALDISGRPSLNWSAPKGVNLYYKYRGYTIMDARELIRAFAFASGINLHVDVLKGDEPHHILESIYKALGRSLELATRIDPRIKGVPSTKGKL